MRFSYELLSGGAITRIYGAERGGPEATRAVLEAIVTDRAVQPSFGLLVDARSIVHSMRADEAREVAALHGRLVGDRVRRTALLAREGAQYGIGRMLQIMVEIAGGEIAVFTEEQAALAWLEQPAGRDA